MKRYRIEAYVVDHDNGGDEAEVGEFVTDALEELGQDFKVEGLSVYEVCM